MGHAAPGAEEGLRLSQAACRRQTGGRGRNRETREDTRLGKTRGGAGGTKKLRRLGREWLCFEVVLETTGCQDGLAVGEREREASRMRLLAWTWRDEGAMNQDELWIDNLRCPLDLPVSEWLTGVRPSTGSA